MRARPIIVLAALAMAGSAAVIIPASGAPAAAAECLTPARATAIEHDLRARLAAQPRRDTGTVTISVVFHVVHRSDGRGNLSDATVAAQLAELNEDFAGRESPDAADTGFSFQQQAIRRWSNDQWFDQANDPEVSAAMRTATREGGAATLNIWTTNPPYNGQSTFPWDYEQSPRTDGVILNWGVTPGGHVEGRGEGKTASHETGHWLGLFHTFENGCSEENDLVADTPAHVWPGYECPVGDDTCELPGEDPIHNYMSYADDSCYNQFTPGQAARAHENWAAYRE
jgi:hypothetical protein